MFMLVDLQTKAIKLNIYVYRTRRLPIAYLYIQIALTCQTNNDLLYKK